MLIDVHDHGIASPDEKNKVVCNYCGKEVSGFYRLKCHLGHLRGDVKPCEQVPSNVKDLMITQLRKNKRRKLAKEADQSCHTDIPLKMNCSTSAKNISKQADLEQIEEYVSKVKDSWAVTGCSFVIDEWEDYKRRHLINFLADSPEGTIYIGSFDISSHVGCLGILQKLLEFVIDNVGLKNVVQIIVADTVSWMWPATRQIVFKHKNVCRSLGASHYIGLMLYNIGMMEPYREILNEAKRLTEFVHGHTDVLKMFRSYFHGHDLAAKPYKIRPLYGVGYYLNPALLYTKILYLNRVVEHVLKSCIFEMFEGRHVQDLISQQFQKYEHGEAEWWSRYGAQCPELQKLAIRILSQTCDVSTSSSRVPSHNHPSTAIFSDSASQPSLGIDAAAVPFHIDLSQPACPSTSLHPMTTRLKSVTKYKIEGIERLICEYGSG
ncbi:hypothetical protein EZV62_003518 [Acer yangbiense]|uniref:DUF659 domain-containing protein n=1 Tax=Acer yangbiense TaxID=1000413 RepID=A0A5C7IH38_9ROSI|nr:hypothetical protein EZV62_003518 [Acer yangbiense]